MALNVRSIPENDIKRNDKKCVAKFKKIKEAEGGSNAALLLYKEMIGSILILMFLILRSTVRANICITPVIFMTK